MPDACNIAKIYSIYNMKQTLLLFLLLWFFTADAQMHRWGDTSRLTVENNYLVDPDGNQVMLHGVMDTPSPYFSGYRFTDGHWINVYQDGDKYINKCIDYFDHLFTAVTDTAQGSWCNVFRLHLDPCWTDDPNVSAQGFKTSGDKTIDPNGNEVSGESNIQHFSEKRLVSYLDKLYLKIAEKAKGHGLYVIMRPPGVCPRNIKVGDYYQEYLLNVWDKVTSNDYVKKNSAWLSIELANEPINVLGADGKESNSALHDFFQPIVDKIRANGFDGIIWVPGATWQQNYRPYAEYPITDPMSADAPQIGYAVHFYPGWYNTSDTKTDTIASIRSFLGSVPVVKTSPVMITEVDWSPEDPDGTPHQNEVGEWVKPNCGTWATGSTSKFGMGFKAIIDYFGNLGWTLTHTHDYIDIDEYLSSGKLVPAFSSKLTDNAYEACSGACFKWYPQYAKSVHQARAWNDEEGDNEMFPLNELDFNPSIWETGSFDPETGKLVTGQYGFGGWQYEKALDLSAYQYVVVQLKQPAPDSGQWSASFRLFCNNSYWTSPYSTSCGGQSLIAVPLHGQKNDDDSDFDPSHVYIAGFWTLGGEGNAIYIDKVFVSNDGIGPVEGIDSVIFDSSSDDVEIFLLNGQRATGSQRGFMIIRKSDGTVKKVFTRSSVRPGL